MQPEPVGVEAGVVVEIVSGVSGGVVGCEVGWLPKNILPHVLRLFATVTRRCSVGTTRRHRKWIAQFLMCIIYGADSGMARMAPSMAPTSFQVLGCEVGWLPKGILPHVLKLFATVTCADSGTARMAPSMSPTSSRDCSPTNNPGGAA